MEINGYTLATLKKGQKGVIQSVDASDPQVQRLMVLGLVEGTEIGALEGIPHGVGTLTNEDDFRDELEQSLAGTGLYVPFLLLAMAFLMAEGLLGAPAKKWKDRGKGDTDNKPGLPSTNTGEGII